MDLPEPVEVVVRCPGMHVRLSGIHARDPYEAEFSVELHTSGLDARLDGVIQSVWDRPLADFLDELVADFRGWEGNASGASRTSWLRRRFTQAGTPM
ncbi:hypothetical protein GCM10010517_62810 [Streptosporangium fragile]|uniref:Uncharacterized protein n=1 Tax=Streptosporangium fragile TaxID=46186 RepID=A0ABN3W6N4_9ACTN